MKDSCNVNFLETQDERSIWYSTPEMRADTYKFKQGFFIYFTLIEEGFEQEILFDGTVKQATMLISNEKAVFPWPHSYLFLVIISKINYRISKNDIFYYK